MLRKLRKSDLVNKSRQVTSGEWVELPVSVQCCDCGLVHDLDVRVKGNKIFVQFVDREDKTKLARRSMKCVSFGKRK